MCCSLVIVSIICKLYRLISLFYLLSFSYPETRDDFILHNKAGLMLCPMLNCLVACGVAVSLCVKIIWILQKQDEHMLLDFSYACFIILISPGDRNVFVICSLFIYKTQLLVTVFSSCSLFWVVGTCLSVFLKPYASNINMKNYNSLPWRKVQLFDLIILPYFTNMLEWNVQLKLL